MLGCPLISWRRCYLSLNLSLVFRFTHAHNWLLLCIIFGVSFVIKNKQQVWVSGICVPPLTPRNVEDIWVTGLSVGDMPPNVVDIQVTGPIVRDVPPPQCCGYSGSWNGYKWKVSQDSPSCTSVFHRAVRIITKNYLECQA